MFPSPYGVTVIKSDTSPKGLAERLLEFPSPYGVTVIKSSKNGLYTSIRRMFPSPYGVTVIKSNERKTRKGVF